MVPTQISCAFFFPLGFFVAGFFWPASNRIRFVSGCSALFALGLFFVRFHFQCVNGMLFSNLLSVASV